MTQAHRKTSTIQVFCKHFFSPIQCNTGPSLPDAVEYSWIMPNAMLSLCSHFTSPITPGRIKKSTSSRRRSTTVLINRRINHASKGYNCSRSSLFCFHRSHAPVKMSRFSVVPRGRPARVPHGEPPPRNLRRGLQASKGNSSAMAAAWSRGDASSPRTGRLGEALPLSLVHLRYLETGILRAFRWESGISIHLRYHCAPSMEMLWSPLCGYLEEPFGRGRPSSMTDFTRFPPPFGAFHPPNDCEPMSSPEWAEGVEDPRRM